MLARSPRGRRPPSFAVVVACAVLPACAAAAAPTSAPGEKALHAWEGGDSPAALEAWVQDRLRRADADVARVLGAKGARSVPNTLRPYDDAVNELLLAVSQSSVIYGVGATRELRDKAQSLTQTANAAYTGWTGTMRRGRRSRRCRTRSPRSVSPSSARCTMTYARRWPTRHSSRA